MEESGQLTAGPPSTEGHAAEESAMRGFLSLAAFAALSCSPAGDAVAQGTHALAVDRPETRAAAAIAVTSPDFAAGAAIPLVHSAYGDGVSPELRWSGVPARARSLVLMMEDPDATSARPFVHWLAWNIDPAAGALGRGSVPAGVVQGRNSRGASRYFGPRPHGARPHHYHFQLFALDTPLTLAAGADRERLLAAMRGHVIARGDLVGLFAQPRRR
jgi:Raf kinase inhibitor-like YbhB/YbcL family protein